MSGIRLGVDVGGTFTDAVALIDGRVRTAKVPTTSHDQSEGVLRAVEALGLPAGAVETFAHGMTVATNALLERRGARTALVTTAGFRDVLEIGRQTRPSLYDLALDRPPPLVPRELRLTVRERMGPAGVIEPLDESSLAEAVAAVGRADVEAVAVVLLFGYLHQEHERRVGAALRRALPDVRVSLSCEVLPEFREYERTATTAADAYLGPRLAAYLGRLGARAGEVGLPEPLVMRSSGGVMPLDEAAGEAAACVLSGPAGGVVGAALVARLAGFEDALTFDMGGTSTDVAPIVEGAVATRTDAVVAGVPLRLPMVDVHTVSAGGGSIASVDAGGTLRVGPRSAGADPGPAGYGRGGSDATVTDAALVLGLLPPDAVLGGGVRLDRSAAVGALERLGDALGLDAEAAALGVLRVAEAEMARALRVVSVERGLDPQRFALVAFGGAGGLHACALADELGIEAVLVPRSAGVLSALGLAAAELRRDGVRPHAVDLDALDRGRLEEAFAALEAEAAAGIAGARTERRADVRYRGQAYELTVPADDADGLGAAFAEAHERRYGYRLPDRPVEVVALRVTARAQAAAVDLAEPPAPPTAAEPASRRVRLADAAVEVPVHDRRALGAGSELRGPALVEFPESVCLVGDGWAGAIDEHGTLVLRRERRR